MSRIRFDLLLEKYLAGQCTPEEKKLVEQWYAIVGEEEETWNADPVEKENIKNRIWNAVEKRSRVPQGRIRPLWQGVVRRYASVAAAVVFLLSAVAGLYWSSGKQASDSVPSPLAVAPQANEKQQITLNAGRSAQEIRLADGSRVWLSPGAELRYPASFAGAAQREVLLSGDAFFSVTKDSLHPFLVQAGDVTTRVLGTSFWVKTDKDRRVQVSVRSGRVLVYSRLTNNAPANTVLLTPNQQVECAVDQPILQAQLVETPLPIPAEGLEAATLPDFYFRNADIGQVLQAMEKAYGVYIVLEQTALSDCDFTGDLNGMDFKKQLALICKSLNAGYRIEGTRVIVSGVGCAR